MRVPHASSLGQIDFIGTHHLWPDEQRAAAQDLEQRLRAENVQRVRISWCDQQGIARGKTLATPDFLLALRNGQDFQRATLTMDTTNSIVVPLFAKEGSFGVEELAGYPGVLLIPELTTFRMLPWSPGTGWVLANMYLKSGRPVPFCSRQLMKSTLAKLRLRGYEYLAGLEVEFYITKLENRRLTPAESGWPDLPIRKVVCAGTAVCVEAAVGPDLANGEMSIWNKIGTHETGPRYLGEKANEYRDEVNLEPCWTFKIVPRKLTTWQGLGWAKRYRHNELYGGERAPPVTQPTYYG